MELVGFDLKKAKKLYEEGPLKKHLDCIQYISKYIYPTVCCNHFVWDGKNFISYKKDSLKEVYFNRLPKDIQKWYFNESDNLYNIISDVKKPSIEGLNINLCSGLLYKQPRKYETFSENTKISTQRMLTFIKEIISGNLNDVFQYNLKWLANMCHGNKNDSCLYNKGEEGIGKSTFTDFLIKYVIGNSISIISNSDVLRTANNKSLCGKLLVVFEELPTFSKTEWEAVSGKLKNMITGNTLIFSDKYEKGFEAPNINNYIINTNVSALKHSEGRRYMIEPLNNKYKGNHLFFENIKNKCFNNEVGEAFFSYLLEINIDGFNAQKSMPETTGKQDAIVDRLDIVYQFLKSKFILKNKPFITLLSEAYKSFEEFCTSKNVKGYTKIQFNNKLKEIGILCKQSNGRLKFNLSIDQLNEIAKKHKWIHETDEFNVNIKKPCCSDDKFDELNED